MSCLKDFEILGEIGKGAFGYVYKVKRIKDGNLYALKKVYMNKLKPKEKENSLNEIRILASIAHINVISYKEAFYDNASNCINIVMEFAESGDLEKKINSLIKSKKYMTETEIFSYFLQIVNGLKALHDKKILHRDIKAANIFLFLNDIVKIGDMNVSKVMKMGMLHTQTGTPYYASPEVWNDKPYDYKSDIWSLGCLIYEMTTLKAPFRGTTMKAVFEKVMKGVYDPIPSFYSKSLANIINMMLQINHHNRPNADQLIGIINDKIKNSKLKINSIREDIRNNKYHKINSSSEKLLKTIKIPKRMNELNLVLPRSKYINRIKSSLNPISVNKTEILQTEDINDSKSVGSNIGNISAVHSKKEIRDMLNNSEVVEPSKEKNKENRDEINIQNIQNKQNLQNKQNKQNIQNVENKDGKKDELNRSIEILDIRNDNPLDVINKPILIKKKLAALANARPKSNNIGMKLGNNNINNSGSPNNSYLGNVANKISQSAEDEKILPHRKILNLKMNYHLRNNKNNVKDISQPSYDADKSQNSKIEERGRDTDKEINSNLVPSSV